MGAHAFLEGDRVMAAERKAFVFVVATSPVGDDEPIR
jgi:hypothetical protein